MQRLIKQVPTGVAIGADAVGRYLSPGQRAVLVEHLSGDAEARAADLLAEAERQAGAIVAEAEARAEQTRARAHAAGYAAGYAEGTATAMREVEAMATMLRRAADAAGELRAAVLTGAEEQVVALALTAARKIVLTAAEEHAALATLVVRDGLRAAASRVLRVRVHPNDAASVSAALLAQGEATPVHPDSQVDLGGCLLDVEGGVIDLRIGPQLERLERTLLDAA